MRQRSRAGFTLFEVLVALALTGVLALLASAVIGGIIASRQRAMKARDECDEEMRARRWLVTAIGSVDVTAGGFEGTAGSARFMSWLPRAEGWLMPEQTTLFEQHDTLWLATPDQRIPIRSAVGGVQFDYLLGLGLQSVFVTEWSSPVAVPLALRIRIESPGTGVDTLLLLIGERG